MVNHPELPLDKPEQFLLELSEIPHFAERIACFVTQSEFNDSVLSVRNKLSNMKATCEVFIRICFHILTFSEISQFSQYRFVIYLSQYKKYEYSFISRKKKKKYCHFLINTEMI